MAKNASHFEYDGFSVIDEKLKSLVLDDPKLKERIQAAVWDVLGAVRRNVQQSFLSKHKDPRDSVRAIRRSVFKKVIGGAVSILDKKSARRGNVKGRTEQINSYEGADRGFILRFVNSGTGERIAGEGRNKRMSRSEISDRKGRTGYRGMIAPSNFFGPAANGSIQKAADTLAQMIDDEINKQFNNG